MATKTLVIGGTGLVGGHAALYLRSKGSDVTIAGRKGPSDVPALSELPFIQGNYLNGDFSIETLSKFEAVVFAAGSDVRHVPRDNMRMSTIFMPTARPYQSSENSLNKLESRSLFISAAPIRILYRRQSHLAHMSDPESLLRMDSSRYQGLSSMFAVLMRPSSLGMCRA